MRKKIFMIAGPNGVGKTTITRELLTKGPELYEFLNADEIAKGLAPLNPEKVALAASKLMVKRLKELLDEGRSFVFETTAAGTNYIKHLQFAKQQGYQINITFLWLSDPKQAIQRVEQRVKQGGHHIPEDVIVRRYFLGIKNLMMHYIPIADVAAILDGSSEKTNPIARKHQNGQIDIYNQVIWNKFTEGRFHGT